MMPPKNKSLASVAAALLLAQSLALPALDSASTRLTKASVAVLATRDAQAAAVISNGDKVRVTGCHAVGRNVFRCQVELIPVSSGSRCHWTDTIRLVRGKPSITYSSAHCSN